MTRSASRARRSPAPPGVMHTPPYPVSPTGKEAAGLLPLPKETHTMTRNRTHTNRKASAAHKPGRASDLYGILS